MNTQGFKCNTILFEDAMDAGQRILQIGGGVAGTTTTRNFSQGTITTTGGAADAAIQGNGFFVETEFSRRYGVFARRQLQSQLHRTTGQQHRQSDPGLDGSERRSLGERAHRLDYSASGRIAGADCDSEHAASARI